MSAWMPAPPPESDPAMTRTRPFKHAPSRTLAKPRRSCRAELVDDLLHELVVLALGHDAHHRLRAALADQQPAGAVQHPFGVGDRRLDPGMLAAARRPRSARCASRCGSGANTRQTSLAGLPRVDEHPEHLQRGDQTVAGGREIGQDHVAGLLAADIDAALAHQLDDVAVAHLGAVQNAARARSGSARGPDWT